MQIHELNKRQQVNEVDLVGPSSIFNVGKQVLKNPAAITSSGALGAAKQAAAQTPAQQSANTLAKQGYKVGGGTKPVVTTAQQLQAVSSNPAVQQQVKSLASQWLTQSAQLRKVRPVSEAVVPFNVKDVTDPKYASLVKAIQASNASSTPSTQAPTTASDQAEKNLELEKELTVWKEQFKQWTDQKLAAQGVTMDMVRRDAATAEALNAAMSNVAVAAQSGNPKLENQAVEEYLNLAIAGIQAYVNNSTKYPTATSSSGGTAAPAQSDDQDQQILQQLDRLGISQTTLGLLGDMIASSNRGNATIRNTGNPMLNAIARLAGMKVTS